MSERPPPGSGPSRRRVLAMAGGSAAASALWPLVSACEAPHRTTPRACIDPESETERTLAAFVDTVVPGYESDPDGAPGALDACGLNVVFDPALPLAPLAGLLAMHLDGTARRLHGGRLEELDLASREEVVAEAEDSLPELTLAIRLARTAFYGAQYSDVAERWLGVLGPNLGYVDDGFGFGEPQSDEMTDDGNLP